MALRGDQRGEVRITVEDDGVGVDLERIEGRDHHGLSIMRERTRSLGGEIEVLRRAGGGTRVSVSFMAARGVQALAAPIFFEREESRT